MSTLSSWLFGSVIAILGFLGLLAAARALDQGIEYFGLALFAFAVLFDFGLIRRAYGVQERAAEESATDDGSNIAA
jgi:hypothetical protein